MTDGTTGIATPPPSRLADRLNHDCHCIDVDQAALSARLAAHLRDDGADASLPGPADYPYAASPVFVSQDDIDAMVHFVATFETVVRIPAVQDRLLSRAPPIARHDFGTRGAFVSYDFHLSGDGPRLIEVNTNAGGVLLNLYLAAAQKACCVAVDAFFGGQTDFDAVERELVDMFRTEYRRQRGGGQPHSIAIVDEEPDRQPLYSEFVLFRSMFRRHGLDAVIVSPQELELQGDALLAAGMVADVVYNRLTDFYLEGPAAQILRDACRSGAVVLTPAPFHYALYADKRNLVLMSDDAMLADLGVDATLRHELLRVVPATREVTDENAAELWSRRRQLYFKPVTGFGSRGTYRGAKLTRRVWQQILESRYVAQQTVPPGERRILVDGELRDMKVDLRCVTYDGNVQQLSARIYQGQATNLRSGGGGLATVFAAPRSGAGACGTV